MATVTPSKNGPQTREEALAEIAVDREVPHPIRQMAGDLVRKIFRKKDTGPLQPVAISPESSGESKA